MRSPVIAVIVPSLSSILRASLLAAKLHNDTFYVNLFLPRLLNVIRCFLTIFVRLVVLLFSNHEHLQVATAPLMNARVFCGMELFFRLEPRCILMHRNGLLATA